MLKAAGYTNGSDGVWAGATGPLEFELTAPAEFADWSAANQGHAPLLWRAGGQDDFGIADAPDVA